MAAAHPPEHDMTQPARVPYGGIATRAAALALDAALAQLIVLTGAAVLALVGSLVGDIRLETPGRVLAGVAWALLVAGYFVFFWTTAGRTPGMRLLGLRVVGPDGGHPGAARSVVRVVGLVLAIVPLFAGFLPVLVDDRRRALQDFMAHTVVVYDGEDALPAAELVAAPPGAPATPPARWRAPSP
jgi:uncharacterized RDD family membrane protein YckC